MTTTRIPAGPVKIHPLTLDDSVPGRAFPLARVRCPGPCGGVHAHRLGRPRADGYTRRAPCGAAYIILLVAVEGRVAA